MRSIRRDTEERKRTVERLYRWRGSCLWGSMVVLLFSLIVCLTRSLAQQLPPTPPPHPILLPQANRLPDVNAQMVMKQQLQTKKDFDAANTLRQKQIGDDSVKLLILAKDLKAQMDLLGDKPVPERLQREAAVIELLAHDVQTRMTLTVGGS